MLTMLSLWAIYFASYLIDYILILGIIIWKRVLICQTNGTNFWKGTDLWVWGILVLCILISIYIVRKIKRIRMNTRIKLIPEKDITYEMTGYLLAQVATVATTLFTDWWIIINIVVFLLFGFFYVKSKAVYTSPLFVVPLGNRILQAGDNVLITNYSLQEMRIAQEDSLDGLEARELSNHVYYVRKQNDISL